MKLRHSVRALLTTLTLLTAGAPAYAEMKWGFADASFNRLDWDRGTEKKSPKRDFNYLEIEGGGQFNWGELYGFFDLENVAKPGDEVRSAAKGSLNYYLGTSGLTLYGHVYNFTAFGFSEQNRVYGLGYVMGNAGWWFKPFIGVHEVSQTFFSGFNGYMAGWVFGRFFTVKGQKFLLADWHEMEFARSEDYARGNGGKTSSVNGAASLWWIPTDRITLGVQWRYASDKLGTGGAMNAAIYTVKFVF